jgi:hypothetical protein
LRRVRSWLGVTAALMVLAAGCSREPDSKDGAANMREGRSAVAAQVRAAAKALTVGDTRAVDVKGGFRECSGGGLGASRVRYTAGGFVDGGQGSTADRVSAALGLLERAGWRVTDKGSTVRGGAYGRLRRDGVQLAVDEDQLEGSDRVVFGAATPCFDVTDEQANDLPGKERIAP